MSSGPPIDKAALASKLEALASQLGDAAKGLRDGSLSLDTDTKQRMAVLESAKAVASAVRTPADEIIDLILPFSQIVALRLFVKWKVFEIIPASGNISYKDLAAKIDADTSLITRFAWVLVSTGFLEQIGSDSIAHTSKSRVYSTRNPIRAMVQMGFDNHFKSFVYMPEYFDKYGLKEPTSRHGTIYACAEGVPELDVWQTMNRDKEKMENFMLAMDALAVNYPVLGSYSMGWVVEKGKEDENRALVVDVGGGKGHALRDVVKATPGLAMSRCVLEDLPEVIEAAKGLSESEVQEAKMIGMDFHDKQPVKGAAVYYVRRILHDYGDEESVTILRTLANAMAPDSRVLVVDQVMSNPPPAFAAATNIIMATIGGKERTEEIFREIGSAAGLKLEKIWKSEGTDVGLVEYAKASA